jgi:hypothetical protein
MRIQITILGLTDMRREPAIPRAQAVDNFAEGEEVGCEERDGAGDGCGYSAKTRELKPITVQESSSKRGRSNAL